MSHDTTRYIEISTESVETLVVQLAAMAANCDTMFEAIERSGLQIQNPSEVHRARARVCTVRARANRVLVSLARAGVIDLAALEQKADAAMASSGFYAFPALRLRVDGRDLDLRGGAIDEPPERI